MMMLKVQKIERPVVYWEGNLVVDASGRVWACYEVEGWHYEMLDHSDKLDYFHRLTRLMTQFPEYEGHLLKIPVRHTLKEHYERLHQRAQGPLAEHAHALLDASEAYVRSIMQSPEIQQTEEDDTEERFFLLMKLPAGRPDLGNTRSFLKDLVSRPAAFLAAASGTGIPEIAESDWRAYLKAEGELRHRLSEVFSLQTVDSLTLQWLQRRPFWRGLGNVPVRQGWNPTSILTKTEGGKVGLRFAPSEIDTLHSGIVEAKHRYLQVTQDTAEGERTMYQSFVSIANLPDTSLFPGSEWIYRLGDLDFPVEISIRWTNLDNQRAREYVRKKQAAVGDQADHTAESGKDIPLSVLEAQQQVAELAHELETSKTPLNWVSVIMCVYHEDLSVVEQRVKDLRDFFAPEIEIERPAGDQLLAFMECMPGAGRRQRDYVHCWLPQVMASGMWGATRLLGDNAGYWVGTIGRGRPVYHDPMLAPLMGRAPGQVAVGPLGSGKSFVFNCNICRCAVFDEWTRGVIFDPKAERSHWPQMLPELREHMGVVMFSEDAAHEGKLDPFALYRELGEPGMRAAELLAIDLLSFLCRAVPGEATYTAIMRACEYAKNSERPSMQTALAALDHLASQGGTSRDVRDKADFLILLSTKAYAHLLFGSDPEQGLSIKDRLTIIQFRGLNLPPAEKPVDQYNTMELLTAAVMNGAVAFMAAFSHQDRRLRKIHLIDEAWSVLRTSIGLNQVLHLIRTGRSTNNAAWLATQNVKDLLDEGIRSHLPVKWIYRTTDPVEQRNVLAFTGLEDTEQNRRMLAELHLPEKGAIGPREALHQDIWGRTGIMVPGCEFHHWAECFNTNPEAVGR